MRGQPERLVDTRGRETVRERSNALANQYSGYVAIDDLHVNGKLTLGENIADLGGLTIAYLALEKTLEGKPRPALIDGFTPEQRFFLSFAQVWRSKLTPERTRLLAQTDPHSPGSGACSAHSQTRPPSRKRSAAPAPPRTPRKASSAFGDILCSLCNRVNAPIQPACKKTGWPGIPPVVT